MVVMAPADENECRQMLYTGYRHPGPAAVRYPRGHGPGAQVEPQMSLLPLGKGEVVQRGQGLAILAFGSPLHDCVAIGRRLNATVANMRFVKPLDADLVLSLAETHSLLVTVEENAVAGGAGSAVNEALAAAGANATVLNIGLPDRFIEHGSRGDCLKDAGLNAEGIQRQIISRLEQIKLPFSGDPGLAQGGA
jgi:1-deoxy-D-xylulose-5-phosphate synthase